MTRFVILVCFCLSMAASLAAQVTDASICDILANPQSFNGKLVRVKGTVTTGFEEFVVKDPSCNSPISAIWLSYPEGTKGKAGPAAFVQLQLAKNSSGTADNSNRLAVKLDKSKEFKQFDTLLSTPYKGGGMCLGCTRYSVTATLTGRLDGTKDIGVSRDGQGKFTAATGYGNLNLYHARLVVQSVADVSPRDVDYSKVLTATKDDSVRDSGGDPVAAAHNAARAFGVDSQAGQQVERAAAAFGKEGEDNGVEVGFGTANEVRKDDGLKSNKESPDGLQFNCVFDMDRLKGEALSRAIAHIGTHIADIRDPKIAMSDSAAFEFEYRAWQTTVLNAVAFQQKTLTAPGGYLLWNSAWPPDSRNKLVDAGISGYLTDWMTVKK